MKRRYSQLAENIIQGHLNNTFQMYGRTKARGIKKRKYSAKRKAYRRRRTVRKMGRTMRRVYTAAITERPPKHILYSDSNSGGAFRNLGTTAGTLATGIDCNNSTPFKAYINNLRRGTTVQRRLADYAYFSSIKLSCRTICDVNVVGTQMLNWMLYVDVEVNGASETPAAFALNFFGSATPYTNAIKNTNVQNVSKKYKVLKRGQLKFVQQVAGQTEQIDWHINWYSKRHVKTAYTLNDTETVADIDTGAICLFMWTDNTVGTIKTYFEGNLYFRDQV